MRAKCFFYALLCVALLLTPFAKTVMAVNDTKDELSQPKTEVSAVSDNLSTADNTPENSAEVIPAADQSSNNSNVVWWIMLAAVLCIAVALVIFRKKIFKRLPRFLSIIIIVVLATAVILPAAALAFPQAADTVFGSDTAITVSFETNGGSDVPAVEIPSGEKLTELPTPMKTDYSFTGWYTDAELSVPFYSDALITNDTTLYAAYVPTQTNATIYEDPGKYVEACDPSYTFSIVSPVELTNKNLSDHVLITAYISQLPDLNVTGSGGIYTISPSSPYTAGGHYRFELMDEGLSFSGESAAVRCLDFRIYKDTTSVVELSDDIIYVLWADVDTLGENAYYVPTSLGVEAGDTVCFWNGELGEDTRFFNILLAAAPKKVDGVAVSLLTTQESQITDVVDKLDVHFSNDVLTSENVQGIDTDQLAYDAKNSEGTRQMTTLLANAISQSPSFINLVSETLGDDASVEAQSSAQTGEGGVLLDGEPFVPITEDEESKNYVPVDLITQSLDENLTVTAYVATAQNENFYNAGPDDWTVLSLTFTYDATIKDKINIKVVFTIKECIKTTAQGDAWIDDDDYTYKDFFSSDIIPDMYFDFALNNYSQTDIALTVLIKTVDTSDDDYLDITKELEKMTQPGGEGDAASFLEEVLGNKGDYIDLVDIPLITISQAIIPECPVFQINIDLNFVVKVNFAAGISAQTTIMSAKQAGISGDTQDGFDSYDNTLIGNNRYTFDFYCAGYLGLKAGLKLSFSFSVYGMPGLGKAGFSGEIGAYLDLYGFMHLNISKLWQYSDNKDVSLQGGLYMEVGIYVELQAFAKSDWFKTKTAKTLYEKKFPLLTVGNQYVLLRFTDDTGSVIMNEEQFSLYGSAGLLDAEYVDIKTGSIVTSSEVDMSDIMPNFSVQFSSPYFEYNDEDYTFSVLISNFGKQYESLQIVSPETKRLDTTVYVYYTGGSLAFSNQQDGDTVKQVNLTWIDSSIDISDYSDIDAVKATYVVDIDGEQQQISEKWVPFSDIPGSVDYGAYVSGCKFIDYTNDPTQPIYEDTVFTIQLKRYQRLVSYIIYHDGSWHFDVYAVNIGDMPNIPDGYDDPGDGLAFAGWIGAPGASAGNLGMASAVTAVDYDSSFISIDENNNISTWNPSGEYVYLGLDTSAPLYSVSGTYDECYSNYYSHLFQGASFNKSSQYLYEAQYGGGSFTVSMVYPAMSYTYCGQKENYSATTCSFEVDFNDPVNITNVVSYPGCGLPEWDEDGDGIADYSTFAELPRATRDITLTAIFNLKTYTVTVVNIDDEIEDTLTVNSGELPAIIKTEPEYPGDDKADDYLFAYWAVSKAGGDFTEWNSSSDPGVFADWTIKPVFEQAYDITFDYAGGSHDGNESETIQLIAGTYNVDELIDYYPVKETDERNSYVFNDWDCGSRFTVSGDMTITAEYTATPIIYTTEFNTATGTFVSGDTHATHTGDYDSTQDFIDGFLAQNGTLASVYTVDKVYTFENWEKISLRATHIWYEAQWNWAYRNYTVIFDAGDGTFSGGNSTKTVSLPYGTSATLSVVSADIVTPEIEGYAYDLTGWKDQADQSLRPEQRIHRPRRH